MTLTNTNMNTFWQMAMEEERRKTFKYWPFKKKSKCTPEKMAAAGFYSSEKKSEPDLARCYVCHKELDGWEEDDDPWTEHKKHAALCPFIKLGKKPADLTLHDVLYLQKESTIYMLNFTVKQKTESIQERIKAVGGELQRVGFKENEHPRTAGRKRSSRKKSVLQDQN